MVVGVNGQQEAMEEISNGNIIGTALNDADAKGKIIAKMAIGIAVSGQVPKDIKLDQDKYYYVPYVKIDRNNVETYLK